MFRPSRPMMRPFMSSEGSSTSDTVVSAAWLAATRWRASATRLRARRFASVRASSSIWRTMRPRSWRTSSSVRSRTSRFASSTVRPEMRSSSRSCSSFATFDSSWSCFRCVSRSRRPCSRRSSSVSLWSMPPSFAATRSSILMISARRSLSSCSRSARSFRACSRASTSASRRIAVAARSASASRRLRSSSASDARRETSRRAPTKAPKSTPRAIPTIRRPMEVPIARSYVIEPVGTAISVNRRPAGAPRQRTRTPLEVSLPPGFCVPLRCSSLWFSSCPIRPKSRSVCRQFLRESVGMVTAVREERPAARRRPRSTPARSRAERGGATQPGGPESPPRRRSPARSRPGARRARA